MNSGFDAERHDLFPERRLDAQTELDDLAAVVGPLWRPLLTAICENAGFTDIADRFGYEQPVVGSFAIKLALEVATKQRLAPTRYHQIIRSKLRCHPGEHQRKTYLC
jgi:hypothetical protein